MQEDKGNYAHIPDFEMILRSNKKENVGKVSEGANTETGGHDGKYQGEKNTSKFIALGYQNKQE